MPDQCSLSFAPSIPLRHYHHPFRITSAFSISCFKSMHSTRCRLQPHMMCQQSSQFQPPQVINDDDDDDDDDGYDELVSNDEYIVVDGKDVNRLVEDMIQSGQDGVDITEDSLAGVIGREGKDGKDGKGVKGESKVYGDGDKVYGEGELVNTMEYFVDKNVGFMPKWVAEAYEKGEHENLYGKEEMFVRAERKLLTSFVDDDAKVVDYSPKEIAVDYNVPVEFVLDMMVEFGAGLPVDEERGIRDCLGEDKVRDMLRILSSYDSYDLSDRYSDRTLEELCETYDIDQDAVLAICQNESIYVSRGLQTRLQLTREDGVLEIALGRRRSSAPYPPILTGL